MRTLSSRRLSPPSRPTGGCSTESADRRPLMRGRSSRIGDRVVGIALGILLGLVVIVIFLFLGSRNTIDEPSLSGGATTQTQSQPAAPPAKVSPAKPSK